ncbi:LytTR family DNA-binding domain-containing protein [Chitinophaga horti]|uniref:LytTR family DNA-binding domain-containing protein n=1 Tax=Chitinophaga horti TaxID=2920382 RepID=A0ABY6J805_9BACT|nr:LytTR family DNA-binding domain-containing protein [Chitinophaga horti]UYQ95461.1 LytTR family DNA-binding domain-containing protein [Chitinophaga horti]
MALQCIIVDDEPLAVQVIEQFVRKMPELELAGTFNNPVEALSFLAKSPQVKLVFLDIQMPELTGVEFMQLRQTNVDVIIVSAYDEYALEGFKYDAVDYLLKPVPFGMFVKAVQKVLHRLPMQQAPPQPDFIFIRTDKRIIRLNLHEILFVEALRNYVAIQTTSQKILTLQNLRSFEEALPSQQFIRVHKSFIVSISKVDSVEKQRIFMGAHLVPVGDTYVKQFYEAMKLS